MNIILQFLVKWSFFENSPIILAKSLQQLHRKNQLNHMIFNK